MKRWKMTLAVYGLGMIVSYGHIYREACARTIHLCNNPGTKQEACYDTLYYDLPGLAAWLSTMFWPYHWSEVAWRNHD